MKFIQINKRSLYRSVICNFKAQIKLLKCEQESIALHLGIAPNTLSQYLNFKRKMPLNIYLELTKLLIDIEEDLNKYNNLTKEEI